MENCPLRIGLNLIFLDLKLSARRSNTLNELLLENQVDNNHGHTRQQRRRHEFRVLGRKLALHFGQSRSQGRPLFGRSYNHGPHEVFVGKKSRKDSQGYHGRLGQRCHDIEEGLADVTAVQLSRFFQVSRETHVGLPEQEGSESCDQTGENQTEQGVGHAHFGNHDVLGNNEDLRGHHHL